MSKVNLVLGDWSGDGHSETETVTIESNFSSREIAKAYKEGVKLIGVDLTAEIADDYEDNTMSESQIEAFIIAGYADDHLDNEIDSLIFVDLYLFTVKCGNPDFSYELADTSDLHIGGYGFYGR